MVTIELARKAALSLPEAEEKSHFHIPDFRVKNKIFATLHLDKNYMMIKLSAVDQSVFCLIDQSAIYPVPNKWGKQGWTIFELTKVNGAMMKDALATAYNTIATNSAKKI